MAMEILKFFFDSVPHFLQLCLLIVLICPWHWTIAKKHIFVVNAELPKKENKKESMVAHG